MANKQTNAKEVIGQVVVEAARVTIQTMAAARAERKQNIRIQTRWAYNETTNIQLGAKDKYIEVKNFRLEIKNVFKSYSTPQVQQITIIKNLLGKKCLQFLEILTQTE